MKLLGGKVAIAGGIAIGVGVSYVRSGLVERLPAAVENLPVYGEELRALPPYEDSPSDRDPHAAQQYSGPGWYPRRSPDGHYVAVTESWGSFVGEVFLGLLIDRPFIHTIGVWEEGSRRYSRILSIMESDPHSGIAHRYTWSKDSAALLIFGSGRLADDYDKVLSLCLVCLPRGTLQIRPFVDGSNPAISEASRDGLRFTA